MNRRSALQLLLLTPMGAAGAGRDPETHSDSYGDGWPDEFRLRARADQESFRSWSVWLAESLWASQPDLPPEVQDCSALLRFCTKEALRHHNGEWARNLGLRQLPPLSDVRQFRYPTRRLGGALFRVRPGPLRPSDFTSGAFREFADAEHLMRFNTHPVARQIGRALPGDLLFYAQLDNFQPYHSMVMAAAHAVYHTGPINGVKGEIRRPSVSELLAHPEPRWRPVEGNSNFLGVFRWNLLRNST